MIRCNMEAQLVKVCSMGLKPDHLGKTIQALQPHFASLTEKFDFNVCGEGGEYETAVFDCPLFKKHKIVSKAQEVVIHDSNDVCPVAYLQYTDLALEEKSPEVLQRDSEILKELCDMYSKVRTGHLERVGQEEKSAEVKPVGKAEEKPESDGAIVEHKLTLSPSIVNPSLTPEQIKAMNQKDQLIMMMDYLKSTGKIDYIVKVGLFVADLGDFKPLNSEYVKYFGIKPPVRVCVEIPGDEVMAYFIVWEHSKSTIEQFRET